jgi:capsular polysaccharide biosynthesis protein
MEDKSYLFYLFFLFSYTLSTSSLTIFPKGQFHDGKCMINHSSHVSFLWENENGFAENHSFYKIIPLEEKEYTWQADDDEEDFDHFLPQVYLQSLGEKYYNEKLSDFPELWVNYSLLWSNITLRYAFFNNLYSVGTSQHNRLMAIFSNVYTTDHGLIVDPLTCEYVRNGGCVYMIGTTDFILPILRSHSYTSHSPSPSIHSSRSHSAVRHSTRSLPLPPAVAVLPHYDKVISLTSGASGTWHFPMEAFVALAGWPHEQIPITDDFYFHVPRRNEYINSWMSLLKIPENRTISAPIINASTLLVPQMGKCGEIYETQLEWLQKTFLKSSVYHRPSPYREILYIQRDDHGIRRIKNTVELDNHVGLFARRFKYKVIYHNDKTIGTLQEQIERFSSAPIIVAPHGAGLLFTAFSPANTCLIEFMAGINPHCYARIAYIRRFSYMMSIVNESVANMKDLDSGLLRCHNHFEKSLQNAGLSSLSAPVKEKPRIRVNPASVVLKPQTGKSVDLGEGSRFRSGHSVIL